MKTRFTLMMILALGALAFVGCSDDCETTTPDTEIPDLDFAGSDACMTCHTTQHANWVESGHPYKLTKIQGESPDALFPALSAFPNDPVLPPAGYTWETISYTIGGYGWKMRWIDSDGYIITANDDTQYNFEDGSRVVYHPDDPIGTKPYDCGRCHTTGWVDSDDGDATNNQDGLEGMVGTFFAGGVHCEQCHGMGSRHVSSPENFAMTKDTSSALCGQCHTRDSENRIAAKGGFIKHHEQYDEWLHSPHNSGTGCNTCHDPHSSVKFDETASGVGTTTTCSSIDCHGTAYQGAGQKHNGMPGCVDCHMPKASKSAIAAGTYVGDIRTHIWNINTDAVGRTDGMFNEAGNLVKMDEGGQAYVTLDFACYSCHASEQGGEGIARYLTLQELSDFVTGDDGEGPIERLTPTGREPGRMVRLPLFGPGPGQPRPGSCVSLVFRGRSRFAGPSNLRHLLRVGLPLDRARNGA